MNITRKSIPNSGGIKKTITKPFDRFMNRGKEFWNDKEIATTLMAHDTVRIAVGRDIWGKTL